MIKQLRNSIYGVEHHLRKGIRLLDDGNFSKAIPSLTKAKDLAYERNAEDQELISKIFLARGKAFHGYGQNLLAKWDFEKSDRLNPGNEEVAKMLQRIA